MKNSQGEIIGFVMTSIFTADILARNKVLVIYALAILAVVFVVGLALSRGIVQLLKGSLKGHHPTSCWSSTCGRRTCSTPLRTVSLPPTGGKGDLLQPGGPEAAGPGDRAGAGPGAVPDLP